MIIKNPKPNVSRLSASTKMRVEVAHDVASLAKHIDAWQELAAQSVEPNVFYEPWMLTAAIREFGRQADLTFVFIYAQSKADQSTLCGFFPLERKSRFRGLPIPYLSLWRHEHCHIATPLVRDGAADKTLRTFFEWLQQHHQGSRLIELPSVSGDGPFAQSLLSVIWPEDCYVRSYTRAMILPRENSDAYLRSALSGDARRELRRRQRRLEEQGKIELRQSDMCDDPEAAIDQFLTLEAEGWKGKQGDAMACKDTDRRFFIDICRAGLKRQQLTLSSLTLDDRPIAMSCDLFSGPGSFGFKTAFDEQYGSFAPGIQLTLDNIQAMHADANREWMDSCTCANSTWVQKLWIDRKTISTFLIPTGMRGSKLAVALFPLMRWLRRKRDKE